MQKKCVRVLARIKSTESCRPFFRKLRILTLTSIYILEACKFVRSYPQYYRNHDDIARRYPLRPTRRNKLVLPASKLKMHSSGPHSMSIKIYNKIPLHIRDETNDIKFIKLIKLYLIDNCFYTINEFFDS